MESRTQIYAGNKGLANLGNTCYMNSALQCLSHLLLFHPLHERFQAECVVSEECLMKEWFEFQREMWTNSDTKMINPISLLRCFQKECKDHNYYFENFIQNDADEFICLFLDLLHMGIKRTVKFNLQHKISEIPTMYDEFQIKSYESWKRFYESNYSYIIHNFSSQLLEITECMECGYYTSSHDPIQVISLELPKDSSSLQECLRHHTSRHSLDTENLWKCDHCHKRVSPSKRSFLWKTSDVLIFLLKRYTKDRKLTQPITFPQTLDLHGMSFNGGDMRSGNKYALQGCCIHEGSLGGGHYYAICKNHLDKQWYKYNDTHVSPIQETDIDTYQPYLLFYKRL
jgi:ubiquitin C-terminal hydrolase